MVPKRQCRHGGHGGGIKKAWEKEPILSNSLLNDVKDHRQDLDGMKEGTDVDKDIDIEVGGWQKPGDGFEYAKPETWSKSINKKKGGKNAAGIEISFFDY